MSQDAEASRLLHLPAEVGRSIMIAVTRHGRSRPPCLNQKLIDNRVCLRNCFDKNFPEATNLYVPRRSNPYLHGNGLRGTNRQLRREMDLLVEEELKSGQINVPFVLDVMIVKEVGVFPCWMSFPYRPQHLKVLTINLRIVRPGAAVVPDEWVEAAKSASSEQRRRRETRCFRPVRHRQAARQLENLEYDANGKPITLNVSDTLKQGRFYEAGYVQFGREVFGDYSTKWKDGDEIEDDAVLISEGKLACHQLESRLNALLCSMPVSSESPYSVYLRVLARSVGELSVSGCRRRQVPILGRHPGLWVDLCYALDNETLTGRYTQAKIVRDLKDERDHGWDEMAKNLRTVQIRRSHGWVNDDD